MTSYEMRLVFNSWQGWDFPLCHHIHINFGTHLSLFPMRPGVKWLKH